MTHSDVITLLGGPTRLAQEVGLGRNSALHWRERGIPSKHWPVIERIAERAGHSHITASFLHATQNRAASRGDVGTTIMGARPTFAGDAP